MDAVFGRVLLYPASPISSTITQWTRAALACLKQAIDGLEHQGDLAATRVEKPVHCASGAGL
jgi:hypothetical protein